MRSFVAAALTLYAGFATSAHAGPSFDRAPIDQALDTFVDEGRAAGVSALVYKDGAEAYFGAFGLRDRERELPMTRDTIVEIQSMTKPITGAAIMTLYDRGMFGLDDPIAGVAPEFSGLKVWRGFDADGGLVLEDPKRPPTFRDLARHTAGYYTRGYDSPLQSLVRAVNPISPDNTLEEFAKKLATLPLLFSPGERFLYAYGMDVQAYLVERLAGEPFDEFLRTTVLEPLDMNDTGYFVSNAKLNRVAVAYERTADGPFHRNLRPQAREQASVKQALTPGGHGLLSTLDDYMRFALLLLNEGAIDGIRLLRPETVRLMGTDQLTPDLTGRESLSPNGDIGWGLNIAVRTAAPTSREDKYGFVGELYWEGALGTLFWVDPENNLAAVFFVQLVSPADALHKEFRDAVYKAIGLPFAEDGR